jgi:hypothetical protein
MKEDLFGGFFAKLLFFQTCTQQVMDNAWRRRPNIVPDPSSGQHTTQADTQTASDKAKTGDDQMTLDGFLLVAVRNPKDRIFLLRLDRDLANFIADSTYCFESITEPPHYI